jgi:hypothetical protein
MTTYYRGPHVLITDKVFLVRGPREMRFRLELLHEACVACFPVSGRWWSREWLRELRAFYGSHEVVLYRSTDATVFGQIRRGLLRALEAQQRRREQAA